MKIIGVAGVAGSGKDTFSDNLLKYLFNNSESFVGMRRAFADALKAELYDFILSKYGIVSFTKDAEEKEIIRPLFISYGNFKRKQTKGRYWIEQLHSSLKHLFKQIDLLVISDLRFAEYDYDEINYIKDNNGIIVYIEKKDNGLIKPGYDITEDTNNTKIKANADEIITWGNNSQDEIQSIVKEFALKYKLC